MTHHSNSADEFRADELYRPTPELTARIRKYGDVVWLSNLGMWVVLSQPAAVEALRERNLRVPTRLNDLQRIQDRTGLDLSAVIRCLNWVSFLHDGPRHAALRSVFARFLRRIGEDYLAHYEQASLELVDKMTTAETVDFAQDYAHCLHQDVFCRMIGVPASKRELFDWGRVIDDALRPSSSVSRTSAANEHVDQMLSHIKELTHSHQAAFFLDGAGDAIRQAGLEDTLDARCEFTLAFLAFGGDSQAGALTSGLAHLLDVSGGTLSFSKGHDQLIDRPDLVDELLRCGSAVRTTSRYATEDVTLGGQHIAAGEKIYLIFASANMDPDVFECPHMMKAGRKGAVALGGGRHLCSGLPLVRKAFAITLRHLETLGTIKAVDGRVESEIVTFRVYENLPIRIVGDK